MAVPDHVKERQAAEAFEAALNDAVTLLTRHYSIDTKPAGPKDPNDRERYKLQNKLRQVKGITFTSGLRQNLATQLIQQAAKLKEGMVMNPFRPAPASVILGPTMMGAQEHDGSIAGLTDEDRHRNILLVGGTGSGKTETLICHLVQRHAVGDISWILDAKRDYQGLVAQWGQALAFGKAPYNPLTIPRWSDRPTHMAGFINDYARNHYIGEVGKQILWENIEEEYAAGDHANLDRLEQRIARKYNRQETYVRRDGLRGISMRLHRLRETYPAIYFCEGPGVPIDTWVDHDLWFEFQPHEPSAFLWTFLVNQLYAAKQYRRDQGLPLALHTIAIDESLLLFHTALAKYIERVSPLVETIARTREFKISVVISTQAISSLDEWLRGQTGTRIALPIYDGKERRAIGAALGLTESEQTYYDHHLTRGQAIITLPDRWGHPLLCRIPQSGIPKTTSDWTTIENRAFRFVVPPPATPVTRLPEPSPSPSPARPTTTAEPKMIALNKAERTLLDAVAKKPCQPCTHYYRESDLHLQTGDRARNKLESLGLIEVQVGMVVRSGRGRPATGLRVTASGAREAGIKVRGCRGGSSIQHEFLVYELAAAIPRAEIETMVGSKSTDLLTPFNSNAHRALWDCVQRHGRTLATIVPPSDGDLVATEVKVSDATKADDNIQKNHAAGIAFTIVAVLPKDLRRAITALEQTVPEELRERMTVIDVFQLLEGLRGDRTCVQHDPEKHA